MQPLGELSVGEHRRVGCASLPDVQIFFNERLYENEAEPFKLPTMGRLGTHTQRLRRMPSIAGRHEWGISETGEFARAELIAKEELVDRLVGVPITKEALRKTPANRLRHVLKSEYLQKGAELEARAAAQEAAEDHAWRVHRNMRAEHTRQKMRVTVSDHARETRRLPMARQLAERSERQQSALWASQWHASNVEGALEVEAALDIWERTKVARDDLPRPRADAGGGGGGEQRGRRARPTVTEEPSRQQGKPARVAAPRAAAARSTGPTKRSAKEEAEAVEAAAQAASEEERAAMELARTIERRKQGEARMHRSEWKAKHKKVNKQRPMQRARREAEKVDAAEVAALPDLVDEPFENSDLLEPHQVEQAAVATRTRAQPADEPRVVVVAAEPTAFDFEWVEPAVAVL